MSIAYCIESIWTRKIAQTAGSNFMSDLQIVLIYCCKDCGVKVGQCPESPDETKTKTKIVAVICGDCFEHNAIYKPWKWIFE